MHVANYWIRDIFTRSDVVNGRYSWVDSTNTFAIWYDGEIGNSFDWIFGYLYNLGGASRLGLLIHWFFYLQPRIFHKKPLKPISCN